MGFSHLKTKQIYVKLIRRREQHKENLLPRQTLDRLKAYLNGLESNDRIIASAIKFQRINYAWNEACTLLHKSYWERIEAIRNIATFRREGRCLIESTSTHELISDASILYQQAEQCHRNAIEAAKKFHLLMNVPDLDVEQTKLRQQQQNLLTTREKEKQIFAEIGGETRRRRRFQEAPESKTSGARSNTVTPMQISPAANAEAGESPVDQLLWMFNPDTDRKRFFL